jgi:hypothetical protein
VYALLNYRCFTAKEPQFVTWKLLMGQLGLRFTIFRRYGVAVKPLPRAITSHKGVRISAVTPAG